LTSKFKNVLVIVVHMERTQQQTFINFFIGFRYYTLLLKSMLGKLDCLIILKPKFELTFFLHYESK